MSTFVLIHGAWHGGWAWEKVGAYLEKAGHTVFAPDLPSHGGDPTPTNDVTLQMYADATCTAVNAAAERVILVGHSMGGVVISAAAEQCPGNIERLVYVAAFLPANGETLLQQFPADTPGAVLPNLVMAADGASARVADDKIVPAFYHDVDGETAAWAISKLVPQAGAPFATPVMTSAETFGAIPKTYVECTADNAIPISVQRAMQAKWPVENVITMETSHSPFFSQPEQLAQHLLSL